MNLFIFLSIFFIFLSFNPAKAASYIGTDQCFNCHEDKKDGWQLNRHSSTEAECEACHGPGSDHQEKMDKKSISNPARLESEGIIKLCGKCHFKKNGILVQGLWENSIHAQSGFTCLNCHDPHKIENPKLLLKEQVKLVCYSCHDDKKKTFDKGLHGQKGVQCSDCHLPHGSKSQNLLKDKIKGKYFCQTCHLEEPHHFIADKISLQMKSLLCTNCHQPHSTAKRYLKYKKEELCVHCHKGVY